MDEWVNYIVSTAAEEGVDDVARGEFILCTVTFCPNPAHNLTRPPLIYDNLS